MAALLPDHLTIDVLSEGYRSGKWLPSEVFRAVLQRVERTQQNSNDGIWITRSSRRTVLDQAKKLDAELQAEPALTLASKPLFGIPYAVKDNIDVLGMATTAGCPAFTYSPSRSAGVIAKLDAAGAIPIGKTNLDQFATGLVGMRSPYGDAGNPFNAEYIAGGSSSGSAMATIRGLVAFALGTDTAGSGRIPAGFCNLVGLKPTPGLVSNQGLFPACRSLDCVSVFAHTVADTWQVLQAIADADDLYANTPLPPMLGPLARKVRLGIPALPEFFDDAMAEKAFQDAIGIVEADNALTMAAVDMSPFHEAAALLYDGPWVAERREAIGDFFSNQADAIDPIVRSVITKADRQSAVDAFRGRYRLAELTRPCKAIFERIDVLIVPTAPTIFKRSEIANDPITLNNRLGIYTNFVNLLGLAAIAIPGPFRKDGLPAGITLIGPGGSDHRLAELARRLEKKLHLRLGVSTDAPPRRQQALPPLANIDKQTIDVAVVGAHLAGLPLNWQLLERGARLKEVTTTSADYKLYALPGTVPPKPGLIRAADGGAAIAVEVWSMPLRRFGEFVAEIPAPLSIGTLKLASNAEVKGFLCEPAALDNATDITRFGGWRNFLATRESAVPA